MDYMYIVYMYIASESCYHAVFFKTYCCGKKVYGFYLSVGETICAQYPYIYVTVPS